MSITGFSTDSGNEQCELQGCYFREGFPKSERATTVILIHVSVVHRMQNHLKHII